MQFFFSRVKNVILNFYMKEHKHIKRDHKSELTTFTSYSLKNKKKIFNS